MQSRPVNDQARLLRQLAQPSEEPAPSPATTLHNSASACDSSAVRQAVVNSPQVVLISELPALQGGLSLALHLAHHTSQARPGVLLVDLAPAASRLPAAAAACPERFASMSAGIQPLWTPSMHGRTLTSWRQAERSQVDVIAQPGGDMPTLEQMPRICEQLVRQIGNPGRLGLPGGATPYHTVFLIGDCVGVPLDSACWHAADVVLLLHDADAQTEQLASVLAARLPLRTRGQRIVLLEKSSPGLRNWTARRRLEWRDNPPQALVERIPAAECMKIVWPQGNWRLTRSMAATAGEIAASVLPADARPRSTRQAS